MVLVGMCDSVGAGSCGSSVTGVGVGSDACFFLNRFLIHAINATIPS